MTIQLNPCMFCGYKKIDLDPSRSWITPRCPACYAEGVPVRAFEKEEEKALIYSIAIWNNVPKPKEYLVPINPNLKKEDYDR